ncbi:MAG: hypothetical protein KDB22_16750 [Planctomycetales bacterium]|nr:hypothetical protein [Planctomycetales bacterium]
MPTFRSFQIASLVLVATALTASTASAQGLFHRSHSNGVGITVRLGSSPHLSSGHYSQPYYGQGFYGNQLQSANLGTVYQGYSARINSGAYYSGYGNVLPSHRVHQPVYHDTTHLDYHAPSVIRHGSHYDFVPGHYDVHRTGHWDYYHR